MTGSATSTNRPISVSRRPSVCRNVSRLALLSQSTTLPRKPNRLTSLMAMEAVSTDISSSQRFDPFT